MTILGASLGDLPDSSVLSRIVAVCVAFLVVMALVYYALGSLYRDSVTLDIQGTPVTVRRGDIFETPAFRIIGCDSHFDTRVDDVVISKGSLHGQLVLEHGDARAIASLVEAEARRRGLRKGRDGLYDFPLGSIVKYESEMDGQTYLMLAMVKLDSQYRAHTNMAEFEQMLMRMWAEADRVYAGNDIALPLLGTGITRFDGGPKRDEDLLRCMLCTLGASSAALNSNVTVVLYGDGDGIPLYEFKDMFRSVTRRR